MSIISELLEHRTALLTMKTQLLGKGSALMAGELNKDLQRCDMLIELAIKEPPPKTNKPNTAGD